MSEQSFRTAFSATQSPQEVFDAINNVRGWWSENIDGPTDRAGAEFTYDERPEHLCRMRLIEAVPGRKVAWLVLENYFGSTEDPEWQGTTISFDIAVRDGRTEVSFAHQGLVPDFECYDSCSTGWSFFVNTSLPNLIASGAGEPIARRLKAG